MLKDKSRILLLGALVLLVLALTDGGFNWHAFRFFHGASWLRWVLFGLLFWLIFSRMGCCGGSYKHHDAAETTDEDDGAEEEADEKED